MVPPGVLSIASSKAKPLAKANELAEEGAPVSQDEIPRLELARPSRLARPEHLEADALYLWSIYVWHVSYPLLNCCAMAELAQRNCCGWTERGTDLPENLWEQAQVGAAHVA